MVSKNRSYSNSKSKVKKEKARSRKKGFFTKVGEAFVLYYNNYKSTLHKKDTAHKLYSLLAYFALICATVFFCEALLKTMFAFINVNFRTIVPNYAFILFLFGIVIFIVIMSNLMKASVIGKSASHFVLWLLAIFFIMGTWNIYVKFVLTLLALLMFLPDSLQVYKAMNFWKIVFLAIVSALFWLGITFIQGTYSLDYHNFDNIPLYACNSGFSNNTYNISCLGQAGAIYSGVGLLCMGDLPLPDERENITVTYISGEKRNFDSEKYVVLNENMTKMEFTITDKINNVTYCHEGFTYFKIYTKSEVTWTKEKVVALFLGLLYLIFFLSPDMYEKWRKFIKNN
jgi:hypothetical protein